MDNPINSFESLLERANGLSARNHLDAAGISTLKSGAAELATRIDMARETITFLGDARPRLPTMTSIPSSVRVSVVIPTLNERDNLPHVLPWIPSWVHEVLLVDGHSVDGSVELARELRPDIRIVMQEGRGKGDALRAGFAAATGDIIVMMDADGSTNPQEIPAFVGALLAGADFAKGSRFMQGGGTADMPRVRRFGHGLLVKLVRTAFGCSYSDLCYGYNAFWRDVLPQLNLDADGFEIETMMNVRALRAHLRVAEVHSFEEKRINGEGRLRAIPDGLRVLRTIFKERLGLGSRIGSRQDTRASSFHETAAHRHGQTNGRRTA